MQDRYAGDIRDFGKYALLNHLCKGVNLKLGVNWYLVSDEHAIKENNRDGSLINYTRFETIDPHLYKQLQEIASTKTRGVDEIEKRGILPSDTLFYNKHLPAGPQRFDRDKWFDESLCQKHLKECEIIFCDPDNGLEIASCSKYHPKKAHKHIFIDEVKEMYRANKSLIVYQHSGRTGTHDEQIGLRRQQLLKTLQINHNELVSIVKGIGIYFLIIIRPEHKKALLERLTRLIERKWENVLELKIPEVV